MSNNLGESVKYYRKLLSEHLQYFVLNPLKNYLFRCLSLGHMARLGVNGLRLYLSFDLSLESNAKVIFKVSISQSYS